ncbi:hypothetical protein F5Y06DRAFT_297407 [Hypoxylon sp. FL0890]|nr:hypothetical protein F5Y06DRAFT_297407 [Hypoxylon sp. FL0890]
MTSRTVTLHQRLDSLYDIWMGLNPDSPQADFAKSANFFEENCTVYLLSMREISEPSRGREGVIKGIKEVLKNTRIKERRVEIDLCLEVAVVVFNDKGLITNFKLYYCRSPVVQIIQDITGNGPYKGPQ